VWSKRPRLRFGLVNESFCVPAWERMRAMACEYTNAPRVLFATGSNDPLIETIERHLNTALKQRGGQLLRVVEKRRPTDDGIPTIDLSEAMMLEPRRAGECSSPAGRFDQIVEDTFWFDTTAGLRISRASVGDTLAKADRHAGYILRTYRPDTVLVWNGLLSQRAGIATLARQMHILVWFCERGPLPGSWYPDPLGINGGSSLVEKPLAAGLDDTLDAVLPPPQRQTIIAQIESVTQSGISAWDQQSRLGPRAWQEPLGLPDGVKCLFFPLQVAADTNMRFFSPHFASSREALRAVADAVREASDWFLLVKPHPKGSALPGEIERVVGSQGRCVADINLHDALALATLVVTINSTVATEAAWQNKPVLQLGRGILTDKGIVSEYNPSRSIYVQLEQAIRHWYDEPERFERSLRFHHFLNTDYLLRADEQVDSDKLVDRLSASMSRPTVWPTPLVDATTIARQFVWEPAVRLFDRLAQRQRRLKEVILLGYGQNARRLLQAAELYPEARNLCFSVWDDDPEARRQASQMGLEIRDPSSPVIRSADTLIVVTPRDPTNLLGHLWAHGCRENEDYVCLCESPFCR